MTQRLRFSFNGEHELLLPDGEICSGCAADIIEGRSYPFPLQSDPKVVVDIGAHAGEFTVMAALIWPKARICAYEPHPGVRELLVANTKQFKNVIVYGYAVGAQGGPALLHISDDGTVCNSLRYERLQHPSGDSIPVEKIGAKEMANPIPDVLKIDAEGVEWEIIEALKMHVDAIHRIYVEFHSELDRQRIMALLDQTHSLGYARVLHAGQGELMYVRRS